MKNYLFTISCLLLSLVLLNRCNSVDSKAETARISFYKVPLVCGADSTIGCGSRIKPLFLESAKHPEIKESWANRQGTLIAFVWNEGKANPDLAQDLFEKFGIESEQISDEKKISNLSEGIGKKNNWYKGMEVDSLSFHEAGTIARTTTQLIVDKGLISPKEAASIRPDIETYFKGELVKVRNVEQLIEDERTKWMDDGAKIYAAHIGPERAAKVRAYYAEYLRQKIEEEKNCTKSCTDKKDCCSKK